jgi:hypothetical protein
MIHSLKYMYLVILIQCQTHSGVVFETINVSSCLET